MINNFRKMERAKRSQKKFNSIAGTMALVLVMVFAFVFGSLYLANGQIEATEPLVITAEDVIVNADHSAVKIKGTTTSSAKAFVRHKYKIKDDCLYLRLRYTLATSKNRSGDFNIIINDDLSKVNKIYLQGKSRQDLKLLWSR